MPGQIDRLHDDEARVLVADFKTGPAPAQTPIDYVRQMALYAALLEQIYPGRQITTWLVWTEACAIEELDEAARASALGTGGKRRGLTLRAGLTRPASATYFLTTALRCRSYMRNTEDHDHGDNQNHRQ